MWTALWALLATTVSSAQIACGSKRSVDSSAVQCVRSLRSGGPNPSTATWPQECTRPAASATAPCVVPITAWSLPWLARRKRGRRKGAGRACGSTINSMPAVDAPGKMAPTAAIAFSNALASLIGAVMISGGTLGIWPQGVAASPFDPRPPPTSSRQPFFEGWFIRCVYTPSQVWNEAKRLEGSESRSIN